MCVGSAIKERLVDEESSHRAVRFGDLSCGRCLMSYESRTTTTILTEVHQRRYSCVQSIPEVCEKQGLYCGHSNNWSDMHFDCIVFFNYFAQRVRQVNLQIDGTLLPEHGSTSTW
jgi:hypothetical protein